MLLVLDQRGAGEEIEVVEAMAGNVLLQTVEKEQEFLGRHRQAAALQAQEEIDQHGAMVPSLARTVKRLPPTGRTALLQILRIEARKLALR